MASLLQGLKAWMPNDCHEICPCFTVSKEETSCNFQRRKKEAILRGTIVKLIWIALHLIVICSLFLARTDLTLAWLRPRFLYLTAYIFLGVTNAAFYVALCLANPGYLQQGVYALSLSTMKRGSQVFSEDLDIAEQGIGGLAHVDLTLGRRSSCQKEKVKLNLDRTVTLPSLPSQRSKSEFDVEAWQSQASRVAAENVGTSEQSGSMDIFMPPADMIPKHNVKVNTVRTRGSSLGGADDFYSAFKASTDRKERNGDEAKEPLLAIEKGLEPSTSWTEGADDALERRPSKPVSPTGSRKHERHFFWYEGPSPGRWCEFCGAWQLLRSRHCHDCSRCVRRFDHHCTWIGSCVGQDNHLLLWWYLLIQFTLLVWTLQINIGAFGLPVGLTIGRFLVLLYCMVITFVMTGFVAILLLYHTYLVISAQTTFELMLGHSTGSSGVAKVPYLHNLPIDARPFSQGIIKNILDFCCVKGGRTYQMPAALSARKSTS